MLAPANGSYPTRTRCAAGSSRTDWRRPSPSHRGMRAILWWVLPRAFPDRPNAGAQHPPRMRLARPRDQLHRHAAPRYPQGRRGAARHGRRRLRQACHCGAPTECLAPARRAGAAADGVRGVACAEGRLPGRGCGARASAARGGAVSAEGAGVSDAFLADS
ncbi:hypothetical protein B0H10DRAFT_2431925 [Mycena sp. CBHHK59/15]|nr:hypothetical protein B0H10DRAFT_2431925 [Mycena sp. CBHHK59/15]